jgi:hypothetical protein
MMYILMIGLLLGNHLSFGYTSHGRASEKNKTVIQEQNGIKCIKDFHHGNLIATAYKKDQTKASYHPLTRKYTGYILDTELSPADAESVYKKLEAMYSGTAGHKKSTGK